MDDAAGQKLKRRREELNLRYRDVEEASKRIAERRQSDEYAIALSRLAEIENRGIVPSIFRIYSLSTIYRLDFLDVLEWYGIDLSMAHADAATVAVGRTHVIGMRADLPGSVMVPLTLDPGLDLRKTTYLSRFVQKWGKLPVMLLNGADPRTYRYAWVGTEDWNMHPVIQPGALVLIDETRRKIQNTGWTGDFDRPIHLVETHEGYALGWCALVGGHLVVQPHPSAENPPAVLDPDNVDIIGQVVGVAQRFEPRRRRQKP
jgi:transcriptional regulator with XRE-family HTH domain